MILEKRLTRGLLETITVDTTKKLLMKTHIIKGLGNLVPVRLDQTIDAHALGSTVTRGNFHLAIVATLAWCIVTWGIITWSLV